MVVTEAKKFGEEITSVVDPVTIGIEVMIGKCIEIGEVVLLYNNRNII